MRKNPRAETADRGSDNGQGHGQIPRGILQQHGRKTRERNNEAVKENHRLPRIRQGVQTTTTGSYKHFNAAR